MRYILCHTDYMVKGVALGTKSPCMASHESTGIVVVTCLEVEQGDGVIAGLPRYCSDFLRKEN